MTEKNEEKKPDLTLSASRVNTFRQCSRKYYYTYVAKLPRKDWPHFDLGTLVHGSLEHFHENFKKDGDQLNLKKIMKISFKTQKDEMMKEKILSNEILLEARNLLLEYLTKMETDGIGSRIISLEEDFDIKLTENINVAGFVDRIDLDNDGVYHIKDYKTNKNGKYMKPFQLCVYGIHLMNKYPEVDHFRGSYIMIRLGGSYISYDFNKEDVEKCKKELIKCASLIMDEGRWIPKPSKLCDWCDFKDPCLTTW